MAKLVLSLLPACGAASSLSFDATAASQSQPVTKVVTLLKDMLKQLEKEQDEDQEIYDKMGCWCQTNDGEKTKSIKDAENHIAALTTKIEELTAQAARLTTEVKNHKHELAEDQKALDAATENRRQQLAKFNAEEKDMLEATQALESAITVLSKHNSFLQVSPGHMTDVAATLKAALDKHGDILDTVLTPSDRRAVAAFVQTPQDYFDSEPTFKQSYAPQSGQIFGILRQMKETFEANLSQAQKDDMAAQKAFEDLKAAKETEIAASQDHVDTKMQELASTHEKLAQAKQDLVDTKASLNADEQFLMMLKEKCQMTDKEWEDRQKTRTLEIESVSKALEILSGDQAHDTFSRTFTPAFLQQGLTEHSDRRAAASTLLSSAAAKFKSPRLSALAMRVKLDAFTKVKKAIDDLIAQLQKDKADEIKHRDFCISEFNNNQLQTEKKEREKQDLVTKIEELDALIQHLTKQIEGLQAEIEQMQVEMQRAGEDRETQNKEFQMTVADQRETQKLLQAALRVLEGFYGKQAAAASFAQTRVGAGPPPPPGFETYKNSGANGDVMSLIQSIMSDAKALEADAVRADAEAQQAYEDFVAETKATIATKNKDIVSKTEDKAKAESDLVETNEDKESALLELEQLSNYNSQLHSDCDFTIKNFEIRQAARDEEVEALRQAKAILSGSKFSAFLQGK